MTHCLVSRCQRPRQIISASLSSLDTITLQLCTRLLSMVLWMIDQDNAIQSVHNKILSTTHYYFKAIILLNVLDFRARWSTSTIALFHFIDNWLMKNNRQFAFWDNFSSVQLCKLSRIIDQVNYFQASSAVIICHQHS